MRAAGLARAAFCLAKEIGQRDFQGGRQRYDGGNAGASLAALDSSDVVAMHASLKAKRLLSEAALGAGLLQRSAKAQQDTLRVRHGRDARRLGK
jgi:hypothetical protein